MFVEQINELYKYYTKKELKDLLSVDFLERETPVLYDFDEVKWLLLPSNYDESVDYSSYEEKFELVDSTKMMFISAIDVDFKINEEGCRQLNQDDMEAFRVFHDACSEKDKDSGMVSLDDSLVYGVFNDNKLVCVTSLWHFGEKVSDIGVLTHPEYRGKGYASKIVKVLMKNIDRLFLWRCDPQNIGSYKTALNIGFKDAGTIYSLKLKK